MAVPEIWLEVGYDYTFYWDGNVPRVIPRHEFNHDDKVIFIIHITVPDGLGASTLTGYDYSVVDGKQENKHEWEVPGFSPSWTWAYIYFAGSFEDSQPAEGFGAGYFGYGERDLYVYINEIWNGWLSKPYHINVRPPPCTTGCEVSCQETCELSCQETCELSCQETCELSCQETCELSCQEACEVSCQEACELSIQETKQDFIDKIQEYGEGRPINLKRIDNYFCFVNRWGYNIWEKTPYLIYTEYDPKTKTYNRRIEIRKIAEENPPTKASNIKFYRNGNETDRMDKDWADARAEELYCKEACEVSCQAFCERVCQETCEVFCQTNEEIMTKADFISQIKATGKGAKIDLSKIPAATEGWRNKWCHFMPQQASIAYHEYIGSDLRKCVFIRNIDKDNPPSKTSNINFGKGKGDDAWIGVPTIDKTWAKTQIAKLPFCTEACEVSCQEACELSCQETCELSCQEACKVSCQEACELSCQEACELSCQETCELFCQETCELSCQGYCETACEIECQQALKTIGCPIAVIADGTELTDNLGPIREFRDKVLNKYGFKWFVNMYYGFITEKMSPFLYRHQTLRRIGRIVLRGLLWFLQRKKG